MCCRASLPVTAIKDKSPPHIRQRAVILTATSDPQPGCHSSTNGDAKDAK